MPPVIKAEISNVNAPIWKPKDAPNTAPTSMISRNTGDTPSTVGARRRVASIATSTPSSATIRDRDAPVSSSVIVTSATASASPVTTAIRIGASAACAWPVASDCVIAGNTNGYRNPASPTRLTATSSMRVGESQLYILDEGWTAGRGAGWAMFLFIRGSIPGFAIPTQADVYGLFAQYPWVWLFRCSLHPCIVVRHAHGQRICSDLRTRHCCRV